MLPFVQQTFNQPGSAPAGASASQQVPADLLQNLLQIQSQMGFVNPQSSVPFNGLNTKLGNGNRPPGPMNIPNFNLLQNGQVGNSILGSAPQVQSHGGFIPQNFMQNLNVPVNGQLGSVVQGTPAQLFGYNPMNMPRNSNPGTPNFQNGQFGWQNQVQNMNQLGNLALLNPSQVAALAQLMGCASQVAQSTVPQNSAFVTNALQLGALQPNGVAQQANFGQQLPVASQQMQKVSLTPSNRTPPHPQNDQGLSWQGNRGKKHGMHISNSNHHHSKNFTKNSPREAPSGRFQNFQNHRKPNMKGSHKFSKDNGRKGIEISGPDNQSNGGKKRRSLSMFYTEKEIQQWREERKKNYPSKANVEKKLAAKQANADAVAEEAQLRRQQLKEVLAKQVELGFEVPEIPSHYLVDSEEQFHSIERNQKQFNRGRFQKRFDKKGRFDQSNRFDKKRGPGGNDSFRNNERFPKRPRVEGGDSSKAPLSIRKPTLLQKLLSTDIKRDRRRLLQAFRFMVMNSFFNDWPEKPLSFPKVIVNETGIESEVTEEKPSSSKGELASIADDLNSSGDSDSDSEKGGCQEEGEITD
ncbi:hypothetical protein Cgig2_005442 [Carnegiea gigantea]|uniref:FMR1-interacting protein 1 conserved domain-containing protein n=1 Tax=Carnegiea gigantea TaxID=171969 RepID=A0A9Q1KAZ4_9CARY|nr:hypothetical protein Cgig2_005442 [Carnegiea gigantea]